MNEPTQSQLDANRANATKSTGPITPAGKSRAAQNARRHGLLSKHVVLPDESHADYKHLANSYIKQFQPRNAVEFELVTTMVAARWRLRRLLNIETGVFHNNLRDRRAEMDRDPALKCFDDRLAYVFKKLADNSQSVSMVVRYEGTLTRAHDRAFRQLEALRKTPTTKRTQFSLPPSVETPDESAS